MVWCLIPCCSIPALPGLLVCMTSFLLFCNRFCCKPIGHRLWQRAPWISSRCSRSFPHRYRRHWNRQRPEKIRLTVICLRMCSLCCCIWRLFFTVRWWLPVWPPKRAPVRWNCSLPLPDLPAWCLEKCSERGVPDCCNLCWFWVRLMGLIRWMSLIIPVPCRWWKHCLIYRWKRCCMRFCSLSWDSLFMHLCLRRWLLWSAAWKIWAMWLHRLPCCL